MKKMRGIVALCVALTMTAGTTALLAQKDDNKKEVKRSKAEQVDFDTLTMVVDNSVEGRPAAAADIAVTWDASHFFRAPDGSTYVPFTVTIDKSKLGAPNAAVYLAAFPKGAARRRRRRRASERQGQQKRGPDAGVREVRLRRPWW